MFRKGMPMKYVWINPVTDRMYEKEVLDQFLKKHGYKRIEITKDWLSIVREKYGREVEFSKKTVIDVRCPMAAKLVRELAKEDAYQFPEIWPILIHCGYELSTRGNDGGEIFITTPCQALADQGNALGFAKVRFLPWKSFLKELGSSPENEIPKETPIPLGFFEKLKLSTKSLTGEDEIREYFQLEQTEKVDLIEMLYCKGGCHKGDGIR